MAGAPKVCAAADQCHTAGTCDPGTGACSNPTKPNGDPCDDSDACTQSDACQAGVCVGANPVVCPAAATCKTQGTCNPQTGVCSQPVNAPNLTPCDDGSACTDNDYCIAGSCFAGSPKACPWTDACHSGVCNPGTGACEGAQVPNNDPCVDGNACTTGDVCTAGVCGGAAACGVGAPTTVVISEVRSRLGGSGGDEFVELYNTTGAAIDISGWKLKFSNNGNTINTRATVPAGRSIPAYGHYLFAYSSYSGSVAEDQTYTSGGLGDNGGVAITTGADAIIDQVGFGASAALHEGTPLASFPNNNSSCYERRPGSGRGSPIDTGDNSVDFFKNTVCDPQNSGSQPTPAFSQSPGVLFFAGLNGAPVQASATIANTLSGSLTLQSASVSGPNAAEFSFVFASALPQTLASGGTLAVTVTHTPAASGRRFATLLITTSAGETQSLELMAGDAP
ncbi:MAG: lamin tail domain-containing protein [Polyangiaceae bacterium]|nr:lamin tail domain-containing protein [Polyangiaceae bacterium]